MEKRQNFGLLNRIAEEVGVHPDNIRIMSDEGGVVFTLNRIEVVLKKRVDHLPTQLKSELHRMVKEVYRLSRELMNPFIGKNDPIRSDAARKLAELFIELSKYAEIRLPSGVSVGIGLHEKRTIDTHVGVFVYTNWHPSGFDQTRPWVAVAQVPVNDDHWKAYYHPVSHRPLGLKGRVFKR